MNLDMAQGKHLIRDKCVWTGLAEGLTLLPCFIGYTFEGYNLSKGYRTLDKFKVLMSLIENTFIRTFIIPYDPHVYVNLILQITVYIVHIRNISYFLHMVACNLKLERVMICRFTGLIMWIKYVCMESETVLIQSVLKTHIIMHINAKMFVRVTNRF